LLGVTIRHFKDDENRYLHAVEFSTKEDYNSHIWHVGNRREDWEDWGNVTFQLVYNGNGSYPESASFYGRAKFWDLWYRVRVNVGPIWPMVRVTSGPIRGPRP
jgi:hypothetical protein